MAKREYRGQRSAEAFVQFVKEQTEDPVKEFSNVAELTNMDVREYLNSNNYFEILNFTLNF